MMYEMRRRKPESTRLPSKAIFNLPHHIGMVLEKLAFCDTVYTTGNLIAAQLNAIAMTRIHTPDASVTHPTF